MKLEGNIQSQFPFLVCLVNQVAYFATAASEACRHVFVDCCSQG